MLEKVCTIGHFIVSTGTDASDRLILRAKPRPKQRLPVWRPAPQSQFALSETAVGPIPGSCCPTKVLRADIWAH